jgi:hypothetical protein
MWSGFQACLCFSNTFSILIRGNVRPLSMQLLHYVAISLREPHAPEGWASKQISIALKKIELPTFP